MSKVIEANGRVYRMGRKVPALRHPVLKLAHFLDETNLPTPPASVRWDRRDRPALSDPLGNTQYGDCTFAGILHLWDVWEGSPAAATQADALALYKKVVTTFNPSDPSTDVGSDCPTVLAYVKQHGMFADRTGKIAGYVAVDPQNIEHVKIAIWLFGGLYGGLCFPDSAIQTFPTENWFYWNFTGKPDPANGHCVPIIGYDGPTTLELFIDSWGLIGEFSQRCFQTYFAPENGGELYAPLSPDWADRVKGLAPSGFNIAALETYLQALA